MGPAAFLTRGSVGERTLLRHEGVSFRWLGSDEDETQIGQVLLRQAESGPEMVLDIKGAEGEGPYLLVGTMPRGKHFFSATNSARDGVSDVRASWAQIQDGYAGCWIEEDYEYLFTFCLPDE